MADPKIPPSTAGLATELIIEGCLRMIRGDVKGQTPIEPVVLHPDERAKLGLGAGGPTLFYPAGEDGVYFDIVGHTFNIWFSGKECEKITNLLHTELMRAFPNTKQIDDVEFKENRHMHARVYTIELGNGRVAAVKTAFTRRDKIGFTFYARVDSQQRPA